MKTDHRQESIQRLRAFLPGHPLEAFITLARVTGMRRDELFQVTWQEIDLEKGVMHIRNTKTENSSRLIKLSDECIMVLRQHYLRQIEQKGEVKMQRALVFPNPIGEMFKGKQFLEVWYEMLKQAGVAHLCFHDLRVFVWMRQSA